MVSIHSYFSTTSLPVFSHLLYLHMGYIFYYLKKLSLSELNLAKWLNQWMHSVMESMPGPAAESPSLRESTS